MLSFQVMLVLYTLNYIDIDIEIDIEIETYRCR